MVTALYRQIKKKTVDWLHSNRHLSYPLVGEILKVEGEKKVAVFHGVECKITIFIAKSHFCFFWGGVRLPQKKPVLFGHVQMVDCLTHLGGCS